MSRSILIVRHGNTFAANETPRRIGARTDLPLVTSGRAQAVALSEHFNARGLVFDTCLAAPLQRTQQTAMLICNDIAPLCTIHAVDWLVEIDHGPDEGHSDDVVRARIGEQALKAWECHATPPPGWLVDADERRAAWRRCLDEQSVRTGRAMLIVTSNGAARFAHAEARRLRTGAYGEIIVAQGAAPRLVAWDVRP